MQPKTTIECLAVIRTHLSRQIEMIWNEIDTNDNEKENKKHIANRIERDKTKKLLE